MTAVIRIPNLVEQRELVPDVKIFTNREYRFRDVPKVLNGWHFTSHAIRKTPKYFVEIEQAGDVYIAAIAPTNADREKIVKSAEKLGWSVSPLGEIADYNSTWLVLKKNFGVGKHEVPVWDPVTGTIVLDPLPLKKDLLEEQSTTIHKLPATSSENRKWIAVNENSVGLSERIGDKESLIFRNGQVSASKPTTASYLTFQSLPSDNFRIRLRGTFYQAALLLRGRKSRGECAGYLVQLGEPKGDGRDGSKYPAGTITNFVPYRGGKSLAVAPDREDPHLKSVELEVQVQGYVFRVWVDGKEVVTYTDPQKLYEDGFVGIRVRKGGECLVESIEYLPLNDKDE